MYLPALYPIHHSFISHLVLNVFPKWAISLLKKLQKSAGLLLSQLKYNSKVAEEQSKLKITLNIRKKQIKEKSTFYLRSSSTWIAALFSAWRRVVITQELANDVALLIINQRINGSLNVSLDRKWKWNLARYITRLI